MKKFISIAGIGVFSAIAASLCCIVPVITLLAGIGGLASAFSWMEPLRPFFIVFAIFALGTGWYLKLKSSKQSDCECEEKPTFIQSKTFLGIVTFFIIVALTFPYYSFLFFHREPSHFEIAKESDIIISKWSIEGMTCAGCEENVLHAVRRLDGIIHSDASFKSNTAHVEFDKTKTSLEQITNAITDAGYKVVNAQIKVNE